MIVGTIILKSMNRNCKIFKANIKEDLTKVGWTVLDLNKLAKKP